MGIRLEFLLARFAQVVFAKSILVKYGHSRWVLTANGETKKVSGGQLYSHRTQPYTQSPTKRQRGLDPRDGLDKAVEDYDDIDGDNDDDDGRERG